MVHESYEDYMEMARALLGSYEAPADLWEANEHVNNALRLRHEDLDAWILKSQILSSLEDDPAALATVDTALRLAPRSSEAHFVRAAVLADMERYAEASAALETAFSYLTAKDGWLLEDLYYEKAAILEALDRSDEAMAALEAGLRRCPESTLLRSGMEPLRRERMRRAFTVIDGGRGS